VSGELDPLVTWGLAGGLLVAGAAIAAWARARRRRRRPAAAAEGAAPPPPARSIREGLAATRRLLAERLESVWSTGRDAHAVEAEIEEALIGADVGVRTAARLLEAVRGVDPARRRAALRSEIEALLQAPQRKQQAGHPKVVLVTGVNGVGKTTSVGKLAAAAMAGGKRVLLVAADTYRAAAIEQLEAWGKRLGVDVVRHAAGASPSAVAFDGIKAGVARGADLVLVDTAGRLHTRGPLMDELVKVRRVLAQGCEGAPHETLLVLDATTGQNALAQARAFLEAVEVTGVVLTKLDGTARGGVAVAVAAELGLPIEWVGVGEGPMDLRPFDAAEYAEALLGDEP
jgi:fused signal recognition particle receptor